MKPDAVYLSTRIYLRDFTCESALMRLIAVYFTAIFIGVRGFYFCGKKKGRKDLQGARL